MNVILCFKIFCMPLWMAQNHLAVTFLNANFDIWSFLKEFRNTMNAPMIWIAEVIGWFILAYVSWVPWNVTWLRIFNSHFSCAILFKGAVFFVASNRIAVYLSQWVLDLLYNKQDPNRNHTLHFKGIFDTIFPSLNSGWNSWIKSTEAVWFLCVRLKVVIWW